MFSQSLLDSYRIHPILALDPGTYTLGVAVYHVDHYTGDFTLQASDTFLSEEYIKYSSELQTMQLYHSDKCVRMEAIRQGVRYICQRHQIEYVVCEDIYFQRINSYRTMSEGLEAIRMGVFDYNPMIPVDLIPPRDVKERVGVVGNSSDKELMRRALIPLLSNRCHPDIDLMAITEHAVDAAAIGYGFISNTKLSSGLRNAFLR